MAIEDENNSKKDFEDALLGFILLKPQERMLDVLGILPDESYFSDPTNKAAYKIFCKLAKDDQFPGDPMLTVKELYSQDDKNGRGKFSTIEQAERYVNSLLKNPSLFDPDNYKDYAQHIKWEKDKVDLDQLCQSTRSQLGRVSVADKEQFLSKVESNLGKITLSIRENQGLQHISEITEETANKLRMLHEGQIIESGIKTGIHSLDRIITGFNPGETIILAAQTGGGKTALSLAIAENIAFQGEKSVMIFSLEMMNEQLTDRMVGNIARVSIDQFKKDCENLRNGIFATYGKNFEEMVKEKLENQYWRANAAIKIIDRLPIYTTTAGQLNTNVIKSMILQKKREIELTNGKPLGLIVIDYLQIIQPVETNSGMSRSDIVGAMSRKIKQIAKEFQVPILLLAQLNRAVEDQDAPELRNLRESGSIEQDADKVLFIYNASGHITSDDYREFQDPYARSLAVQRDKMKMRIKVAKNRQGNSGECDVIFDWALQSFSSQSTAYSAQSESFDMFFNKYYTKTRSGQDLFWPLTSEELDQMGEMERYRSPGIAELDWVDDAGNVHRLSDKSRTNGSMSVVSAPAQSQSASYIEPEPEPEIIEDMEVSFSDIDSEEETEEETETTAASTDSRNTGDENEHPNDDDDDENIDMNALDLLDKLSQNLNN